MITHSTKIENNQFKVTWNFAPKDIRCSRGNYTATHRGAGTAHRHGIWEGVELVECVVKVGGGPWTSFGRQHNVTVYTTDNNTEFLARATYRIKTMGYHFQSTDGNVPFFYYGNIGGDPNRYVNGYFTDGNATNPGANLYNIHALVPKDWNLIATQWSDWAYNNGVSTGNWHRDPGRYEQRNGNFEGAHPGNGWISDSGYAQAWRKSCMFVFEKQYNVSGIRSSGISVNATTPEITVHPTKGNSGQVTLKYKGTAPGKFKLIGYCKDKEAIIDDYPISGTHGNNNSWTYNINFDKSFGKEYEGNDIVYQTWAKNTFDKESAGSGKKGGHRYNGRPSIPTGLFVDGPDGIIYKKIIFSWNESIDPDKDRVVYDLWLTAIKPNGSIIRDDYLIRGYTEGLTYNYDISNHPDGTLYSFKVRSSDCTIVSDWSQELLFEKGSKPTGILNLISPVIDDTVLYSTSPRFVFKGYDGASEFIVNINNSEFSSIKESELFNIEGDKVMFSIPIEDITNIKIHAYLKNKYGVSEKSQVYNFTKKEAFENVIEDNIIKALDIRTVQKQVIEKATAYNISHTIELVNTNDFIKAKDINDCIDVLKAINDSINNIINNDIFDVQLITNNVQVGDYPDDLLWESLIQDMKNI